jgi:hypothetical protein
MVDKLVNTNISSVITAYEKRIKKLETDKAVLIEKSSQSLRPMRSFESSLRTALDFISNPQKLWASGQLNNRMAVLKLAFPDGFQCHRNAGLRTAEKPLSFKVLGMFSDGQNGLAEKAGFEPAVRVEPYTRFPGVHLKPLGHFSNQFLEI